MPRPKSVDCARRRPPAAAAANGGGANERDRDGDFARRRVSKSAVDPPTVASVDCSRSTGNARRQIRRTPLVAISTCAFHFDACPADHPRGYASSPAGEVGRVGRERGEGSEDGREREGQNTVRCGRWCSSRGRSPTASAGRSVVPVNPIARILCVVDRRSSEESGRGVGRFLQSTRISRAISASADCDRPPRPHRTAIAISLCFPLNDDPNLCLSG